MSEPKPTKGNILIVDDQPENLALLEIILTNYGYRVTSATSGRSALKMAREVLPDLILLDIRLPDLNGYQVCERLKADEQTRDMPIIFVSVMGETEDKVKAFSAGGVDYLTKPLQMEEVLARIETHLALRAAQRQLEEKNAQLEREIAERVRVEEALRRRSEELEALRQVGLELAAELDLDALLKSIATRAIELLGGSSGGFYAYKPKQDILEWTVSIGPGLAPIGAVLHRGEGLSGKVWETGEPLIVDTYQVWKGRAAAYQKYPWTAVLGVPVRWGEAFLGVLDVLADPPRTFSSADAELLALFATQAAIAIRNVQLYDAARRELADRIQAEGALRESEERQRQQERLAAIGQLAGGIAHDFNNLLTSIMLHAQILLGKPHLPLDLTSSVESILGESRRAADLVQQILDFSRRAMIETRPVDLTPFVEKTVGMLQRTLPENNHLVLDKGVGGYVIRADPTRIQQVVMNLATNARDAMPDGGELRIGLARVEVSPGERPPVAEMPTGEWVCLTVSDTGTGMTEEVRSHLFEPFFTTKEPGKGTGLGLAQVHGIVQQHGGHIEVKTEAGQGTTFHIYFPAHREKRGEEIAERASAPPPGSGETILLVEDEEKLRGVGCSVLESLGYRVVTAADGQEALAAFRSAERVDLIVTDVVMPEMGGKQLLQELRKATPALKALAITGYAMREDLQALREAGFVDIIYKPFDIDALAQAIRRALNAD